MSVPTFSSLSVPSLPMAQAAAMARRGLGARSLREGALALRHAARHALVSARVEHVHGPRRLDLGPGELLVTTLVRDGAFHVRDFLDHYLYRLGASHVVLLDNGSRDDTIAVARRFPAVTVLRCPLPYRVYGHVMREHLAWTWGLGRWVLHADVDEHFVHPGYPEVPLTHLLRYLTAGRYTAVLAQMLDMFGDGPLAGAAATADTPLAIRFPHYDLGGLRKAPFSAEFVGAGNVLADPSIQLHLGGIRKTVFDADVYLTKAPLFFMDGVTEPMRLTAHSVENARIADITSALLHYKLVDNLREITDRAVREGNYWQGSIEYRKYQAVLDRAPSLSMRTPTTRTYAHVDQLVAEGFLVTSPAWRSFVASL